jgi:hypothetical protein
VPLAFESNNVHVHLRGDHRHPSFPQGGIPRFRGGTLFITVFGPLLHYQ